VAVGDGEGGDTSGGGASPTGGGCTVSLVTGGGADAPRQQKSKQGWLSSAYPLAPLGGRRSARASCFVVRPS